MKRILAVFILLAALMSGYAVSQSSRINSDIFSFLNIKENEIFRRLQASASQEINILSPDIALIKQIEKLNENLGVFSEISYSVKNLDALMDELNRGKIAFFKGEIDERFFKSALNDLYSPVAPRILPIGQDFFALSAKTALLNQGSNISVNPYTGLFTTKDGAYIFARARLAGGYKDEALLKIYERLKQGGAIVSGAAIFAAFGKISGQRESGTTGAIGVILNAAFLLAMFKNPRIFWLFLAPAFGFLSGLTACFLIFDSMHILSIVVSTSLVGLMLDFGAGWLGLNSGERLERASARKICGLFLLSLFVTTVGYALFLFSPMRFLHQIAVFSVFGLIGAFAASYFLLPSLLDGTKFTPSAAFGRILSLVSAIVGAKLKVGFWSILLCLGVFFGYEIYKSDFNDNVKNYAAGQKELTEDAVKFAKISGISSEFKLVRADVSKQDELIAELLKIGVVDSAISLFSLVNSPQKQEQIKAKFAESVRDEKILAMFEGVEIREILLKLSQTPILSIDELKKFEILRGFGLFFDNPQLIMLGKTNANESFFNTLKRYDARYFDLVSMINENFTAVKKSAVQLKICGFALAFLLLWMFLGMRKAALITAITGVCAFFTLGVFAVFSDVNVFVIFGVILASAVGVDYLLLALKDAPARGKILGVSLAAGTSIISFLALAISQTHAVFSFGSSVGLGVALNMACAFWLAARPNFKQVEPN